MPKQRKPYTPKHARAALKVWFHIQSMKTPSNADVVELIALVIAKAEIGGVRKVLDRLEQLVRSDPNQPLQWALTELELELL